MDIHNHGPAAKKPRLSPDASSQGEGAGSNDFNDGMIRPTLIQQLRGILDQYPDDGQILKELIQNAEDAGAKEVTFLLDETEYEDSDPNQFCCEDISSFQGPALYAYNDAQFTTDDWRGLRTVFDSIKAKDPMKVGRFGLGFKSVFHITDLPSLLSGDSLGYLDPQERYLYVQQPNNRRPKPTSSRQVQLKELQQNWHHQLSAYQQGLFGAENIQTDTAFNGTLFRLPLRTKENVSELCDTVYSVQKVLTLFDTLKSDGNLVLLFLKSLEKIKLLHRERGAQQPKTLLEIGIDSSTLSTMRTERQSMLKKIENKETTMALYKIGIETKVGHHETERQDFMVCQYYKQDSDGLPSNCELDYLPWVGLAMPWGQPEQTEPHGHIFCFLPLPLEKSSPTGLHCHVNGYFAVDQNRRHIKWLSADQNVRNVTDKALLWNIYLVEKLLPRALSEMIAGLPSHEVCQGMAKGDVWRMMQKMIPSEALVTPQWTSLVGPLYKHLIRKPIFFTEANGGKWISWEEAIFDNPPEDGIDHDLRMTLTDVLIRGGESFVNVQPDLHRSFKNFCQCNSQTINPGLMHSTLKNSKPTLTSDQKLQLLWYLIKDKEWSHLNQLNLIPLMNKNFANFSINRNRTEESTIYIDRNGAFADLFPSCTDLFLDRECLEAETLHAMMELARQGKSQLTTLEPTHIPQLLRRVLHKEASSGQSTVPIDQEGFSTEWILRVWKCIQENQLPISMFMGLHLLPIDQTKRKKLAAGAPIIVAKTRLLALEPRLSAILKKLQLEVIESLPDGIENNQEVWSEHIVCPPDLTGVLQALQNRVKKSGMEALVEDFKLLSAEDKNYFRKLVSNISMCSKREEKLLLQNLPMFKIYDETVNTCYTSTVHIPFAVGHDPIKVKLDQQVIDARNHSDCVLVKHLEGTILSPVGVLCTIVLPKVNYDFYSRTEIQVIVEDILKNMENYANERPQFPKALETLKLFENKAGKLCLSNELYDPFDQTLKGLFQGQDVFPAGRYVSERYHRSLLQCGLCTLKDIKANDILKIVQNMQVQNSTIIGEALMNFLSEKCSILSEWTQGKQLIDHLKSLAWVPIISKRPKNYPTRGTIPFHGESIDTKCAPPQNVRTTQHLLTVGAVMPLISEKKYTELGRLFGWNKEPSLNEMIQQLRVIISDFKGGDLQVIKAIHLVYGALGRKDQHQVKSHLQHLDDWVWYGEGFASIDKVTVCQSGPNMEPYVHKISKEFMQHEKLFEKQGVCSQPDYCSILQLINEEHQQSERIGLVHESHKEDLDLAVSILNKLASGGGEPSENILVPIKTPNNALVLMPKGDCTHCDSAWHRQGFTVDDVEDQEQPLNIIHGHVPEDTVNWLQIPSLVSRILDAEDLDLSFGQSEPLTRRLKSLLQEYSDGLAIFKELIQNADDAGATEVCFIFDERQNRDASTFLIDEGLKGFQGSALWSYNNAMFTEEDFANIVKLSGATKETKREKIGRFGLGFNAVYNITDVPSFISGSHVVIFDPHVRHLGSAVKDRSKPGIKLDICKNRKKLQRFKDQFTPFNGIFGCDLSSSSSMTSYPGTLFRLPLRTSSQADLSEISHTFYNRNEVMKLIERLKEAGSSLLLFTQKVQKVTLYHIPHETHQKSDMLHPSLEKWMTIEKSTMCEVPGRQCLERQQTVQPGGQRIECKQTILEKITLAMESGFRGHPSYAEVCCVKTETSKPVFCPGTTENFWYVGHCMGQDLSYRMAQQDSSLLPIAGIAALMQKDGDTFVPISLSEHTEKGQLFCFLPLPIQTEIPVNINGYFALSSSRRYLFEQDIHDKKEWNTVLFKDAVAKAYANFLEDLGKLCPKIEPDHIFKVWPNLEAVEKGHHCAFFQDMVSELALVLCKDSAPNVFPYSVEWQSFNSLVALDCECCNPDIAVTAQESFRHIFQELGEPSTFVVEIPQNALKFLKKVLRMKSVSRYNELMEKLYSLERFFVDIFFPNITLVSKGLRDTLLVYGLVKDPQIQQHMVGMKCIPVSPTGDCLKVASDTVDPTSRLSDLYDVSEGKFPEFSQSAVVPDMMKHVLAGLRWLGMSSDTLCWQEIWNRCINTSNTTPEKRLKYLKVLTEVMRKTLKHEKPSESIVEEIRNTNFLPVMIQSGNHICLPWKGNDYSENELLRPLEMYTIDQMNVVCGIAPIVHEGILPNNGSPEVKTLLGLRHKDVSLQQGIDQLISLTSVDVKNCSRADFGMLLSAYHGVYDLLEERLKLEHSHWHVLQLEVLKEMPCILIGHDLISPRQCAFNFEHGSVCTPHFYQLDVMLKLRYRNFLAAVGVKDKFESEDYACALSKVAESSSNAPVSEKELKTVVVLLQQLANMNDRKTRTFPFYVPDQYRIMRESTDVCYNKIPWLQVDDQHILHKQISYDTAEKIGIKTVRQDILDQCSLGIPFGQKEKLCNRIKKLLTDYPLGMEILKELVQNADDAGASEIHFILDPREHPAKKVFSDSWKNLQGPALCVYNNKPFTEEDIKGIQNLGEGSKSTDPTKTGQYGVGFNCVYHLTETPCILTSVDGKEDQETLCAFDPGVRYVPGASSESPGRRYGNLKKLKEKFPDVFLPFLTESFSQINGSMFRLPLRTENQRIGSEISNKAIPEEKIRELFSTFEKEMFETLLFLNNLTTISLSEVLRNGQLKEIKKVQSTLSEESTLKRNEMDQYVQQIARKLKSQNISLWDIQSRRIEYEMAVHTRGKEEVWLIVQQFGHAACDNSVQEMSEQYRLNEFRLLPRGGVAALKSAKGINVSKGRYFCSLPLPVTTELPVHINGHFALDHESRRNLWTDETKSCRTLWNLYLFTNVIAPAYAKLIVLMREIVHLDRQRYFTLEKYHSLFPRMHEGLTIYAETLAKSLYKYLNDQNLTILPVIHTENRDIEAEWLPINHPDNTRQGFFNDLFAQLSINHPFSTADIMKEAEEIRTMLMRSGMKLFASPLQIRDTLTKANVATKTLMPISVLKHLRQAPLSVGQLPKAVQDTVFKTVCNVFKLLRYCSQCNEFANLLEGTPLVVTEDQMIRIYSQSCKLYLTEYYDLLPHCQHLLLHHDLHALFRGHKSLFKSLDIHNLASLLENIFPADFRGGLMNVPMEKFPQQVYLTKWLPRLWQFLDEYVHQQIVNQSPGYCTELIIRELTPLLDWCLLPACVNQKVTFYPIKHANKILDLDRYSTSTSHIQNILQKFRLPKPKYSMLKATSSYSHIHSVADLLVGNVDKPDSVLCALQHALSQGELKVSLTRSEAKDLLLYFSRFLNEFSHMDGRSVLRALPIHRTISDALVSLGAAHVYIVPADMPKKDMDIWCKERSDIKFLRYEEDLEKLHQYLGCAVLQTTEIYCQFIFPHFDMLTEPGRKIHLQHIKDKVIMEGHEEAAMIGGLQNLCFLPDREGQLAKASQFFSPFVPVFKEMEDVDAFPSDPYGNLEWLEFLEVCGLQCTVTPELFVEYATKIEKLSTQFHHDEGKVKKCAQMSRCIVKHLFDHDELHEATLVEIIKEIKFIAPHFVSKTLHGIHPQYGQQQDNPTYICFKGSLSSSEEYKIWSVAHILPNWAVPSKTQCPRLVQRLEIVFSATIEIITEHLKNVCHWIMEKAILENSTDTTLEFITSVLKKNYDALSKLKVTDHIKEELQLTPCVIIKKGLTLVCPEQIVVDWMVNNQIDGYLYKLPSELGPYEDLLLRLGAEKQVTVQQYANVLNLMYRHCGSNELNDNDKKAMLKALKGLFTNLQHHTDQPQIQKLCLPDTTGRLHESTDIVIVDNVYLRYRMGDSIKLPVLMEPKEFGCFIDDNQWPKILLNIADNCAPRRLSALVKETLVSNLEDMQTEEGGLVLFLKEKLISQEFHKGVIRLIRHSTFGSQNKCLTNDEIIGRLGSIRVVGLQKVETCLEIDSQPVENSIRTCDVFTHMDTETRELTIYCGNVEISEADDALWTEIVDSMFSLFPNCRPSSMYFLLIFKCENSKVSIVLDKKGVSAYSGPEPGFLPELGSFVPIRLHHLLVQGRWQFVEGSYVALETHDDANNADFKENEDLKVGNQKDGPVYIYAKIVKRVVDESKDEETNALPFSYMYELDIGTIAHREIRPASDIYAFKQNRLLDSKKSEYEDERENNMSYEDCINEIWLILEKSWTCPEEERNKIIKRLFLHWHPDMHEKRELSEKVFQFIKEEVQRLDQQQQNREYTGQNDEGYGGPQRGGATAYSPYYGGSHSGNYYGAMFTYLETRVHHHRQERRVYEDRVSACRTWSNRRDFFISNMRGGNNPQPGEARRWLRQAECDLRAVGNDGSSASDGPAYEWACHKCQQAAEKALKAAHLNIDANRSNTHSLFSLAFNLDEAGSAVLPLARELETVIVSSNHVRYPDALSFPRIPHDMYTSTSVVKAKQLTERILEWVRNFIN